MTLTPDAEKLLRGTSKKDTREIEDAVKQSITDLSRIIDQLKELKASLENNVRKVIHNLDEPIRAFEIRRDFMIKEGAMGLAREMSATAMELKEARRVLEDEVFRNSAFEIDNIIRRIESEMVAINRELGIVKG